MFDTFSGFYKRLDILYIYHHCGTTKRSAISYILGIPKGSVFLMFSMFWGPEAFRYLAYFLYFGGFDHL